MCFRMHAGALITASEIRPCIPNVWDGRASRNLLRLLYLIRCDNECWKKKRRSAILKMWKEKDSKDVPCSLSKICDIFYREIFSLTKNKDYYNIEKYWKIIKSKNISSIERQTYSFKRILWKRYMAILRSRGIPY